MKFGSNHFIYLSKKKLSDLRFKYLIIGIIIGMVSVKIFNWIFL